MIPAVDVPTLMTLAKVFLGKHVKELSEEDVRWLVAKQSAPNKEDVVRLTDYAANHTARCGQKVAKLLRELF